MNRLTFLGTGTSSGVPVQGCDCEVCRSADPRDNRLRTSAFLETDAGVKILLDVGPDFRMQSLRRDIRHIDGVCITHSHQDHIGGIDDLRQINFLMHRSIDIFGNALALKEIRNRFDYIFKKTQEGGGKPRINLIEITDQAFEIGQETVIPIEVRHGEIPILGYRFGSLAYITDASFISEESYEKLTGVQTLVLNALRPTPHPTHFSLEEALTAIERIRPERAYLIHLTHLFGHTRDEKLLPANVHLAYDGLEILY